MQISALQYSGKKILLGLVLVLIFGAIMQVWVMNRLSTFGEKINQIERTKLALRLENQILENRIATGAALKVVAERANKLGFAKYSKVNFIDQSGLASK